MIPTWLKWAAAISFALLVILLAKLGRAYVVMADVQRENEEQGRPYSEH